MLNFSRPKEDVMYCVPKRSRLSFQTIQEEFPFLDEDRKRYLRRHPVEIAYETKLDAFKAQLSNEEQDFTEEEINKKYPFWEKRVFHFRTDGWLIFHKDKSCHYLIGYLEGKSSDILHVCYDCLEEKSINEFECGWTRSGGSKKPKKRCKACQEKRIEKRNQNKIMYKEVI